MLNTTIDEATLKMRQIRGLNPSQESNFGIRRSDDLIESLKNQTVMLTAIAWMIGVITIFGSSIALMNIMLVSVTERTKEIGIRKSLGAKKTPFYFSFYRNYCHQSIRWIGRNDSGLLTGYIFTKIIGFAFVIPWMAIIAAIITSFVVAIISGLYPAIKASKLDPVEALRYDKYDNSQIKK
ncbi:ABC transporter permease [Paenimyroides ceti]|uniref:ABC transporter permease n=1 Tax=Paenimyroides ceti TaxID=395087 RepID=UPI002950059F|nr:FtsX-like permease family protein [Paenimyroides ceti]